MKVSLCGASMHMPGCKDRAVLSKLNPKGKVCHGSFIWTSLQDLFLGNAISFHHQRINVS